MVLIANDDFVHAAARPCYGFDEIGAVGQMGEVEHDIVVVRDAL